jgi:hypothetical protein
MRVRPGVVSVLVGLVWTSAPVPAYDARALIETFDRARRQAPLVLPAGDLKRPDAPAAK